MFKEIHKTEKNIRKILKDGELKQDYIQAAEMYRDVTFLVKRAEEVRSKIYPEIKEKFDEIFKEQDKMHSRVVQVGNLMVTLSKESKTTVESVNVDAILTQLKAFLPEYSELIDKVYQTNLQMARIQVNPSLYVLDKEHSNPDVLKGFMESTFAKFIKAPNVATLNESHKYFNYNELKAKGADIMKQVVSKLTPFLEKARRSMKAIFNKSEQLVSQFGIDQMIEQYSDVVSEGRKIDTTPVDENPHVIAMKRMSNKAIATLDDSKFSEEFKELIEQYDAVGDIASKAMGLRKEVSSEIKEEVEELFSEQERTLNSVIDIGDVIVALTGTEYTRSGRAETVIKSFIEELKTLIPEAEETIEAIYRVNKTLTEVPRKSTIRTKVTEDIIQGAVEFIEKIQRFAKKAIGIIRTKNRKLRQSVSKLKDKVSQLDIVVEQMIKEDQIKNPSHYCVVYPEIAIFGVGKSKEEAWEEAEKWADTTQSDWKSHMQLKACTADVYDYVKAKGSPESWNESNGIITI